MIPKISRLKKNEDFQSVFKRGRSFAGENLRLKSKPNGLKVSRFSVVTGLAVSKKATERNRLKRRLNEILRLKIKDGEVKNGTDVVINTKTSALKLDYQQLEKELNGLLNRAGLLR